MSGKNCCNSFYEPIRDLDENVSINTYENCFAQMHFHKSIELVYIISGDYECCVGNSKFILNTGEILFVPSNYNHSLKCLNQTKSLTFIFPECYFKKYIDLEKFSNYICVKNKDITKKIIEDINYINSLRKDDKLLILSKIIEILYYVEKYGKKSEIKETNDFIYKTILYIQNNYNENVNEKELSSILGYSVSYFSKLFKKNFGCNFKYYINLYRYEKIISSKEYNKTNKILNSGFNDTSTFYKFNKKIKKTDNKKYQS